MSRIGKVEDLYRNRHHESRTRLDFCARMVLAALDKIRSLADYPLLLYLILGVPFAIVTPYILLMYGLAGFLALYASLCALEVTVTIIVQEPMYQYYKRLLERKW